MKLISYKEALTMGKEKIREAMVPVKVNRAKKQAELEMCKLDEQIATKEAAIQDATCAEDLNFAGIINMQDSLALLERKKTQYQKILDEMFPEGSAK